MKPGLSKTSTTHLREVAQVVGLGGHGVAAGADLRADLGNLTLVRGLAGSGLLAGGGGRLAARNLGTLLGDTQDGMTLGDSFRATLLDVGTVLGVGRSGLSAGTLCDLVLQCVPVARRDGWWRWQGHRGWDTDKARPRRRTAQLSGVLAGKVGGDGPRSSPLLTAQRAAIPAASGLGARVLVVEVEAEPGS